MKIFQIIDEENNLLAGILLYYEKERTFIIELPEYLDEWTAPLLFTSYVKKNIYTIPRDISFLWVKERVIPSGRQNINDILAQHHMKSYDEMKFLEISEGRCSQDSLYIKRIDYLPDFVIKRQQKNMKECVMLEKHNMLCFFEDDTVRKINLNNVEASEDLYKVIHNERLYQSGKIGTGGYFVTFNDSIDIPAGVLYRSGERIPLKLDDFKEFVQKNIIDTTESCNLLECSRQNLYYIVGQQKITPVKEDVRGSLYFKGDIVRLTF